MSKLDDLIPTFAAAIAKTKSKGKTDEALLRTIAKSLGPSLFRDDASLISAGDPEEIERVRNNFLIKKLGIADGPALDTAINEVLDLVGRSTKNKYRVVVYYLLVKLLKKEAKFGA
ncbi:MAG: DUF2853 family protein [Pedosphaera sp.]|nr:DUF2853 family protein [Pedosphaera sp.]